MTDTRTMGLGPQKARATLRPCRAGSGQGGHHGRLGPLSPRALLREHSEDSRPWRAGRPAAHCLPSRCAEQALPPLQGCFREQQSKTNSQTQQTYFFDSLNIKKGGKKKPTNAQQSKELSPLHSGWGLRVSLAGPWEPRSFEALAVWRCPGRPGSRGV